MKKIYLAHPISSTADFNDSKRVAKRLRSLGYEVYAAAENLSINDKSNDPSPREIYKGDVDRILDCDIFVVNITGGHQDGTISEVGVVSGVNETRVEINRRVLGTDFAGTFEDLNKLIPMVAYTSNARLMRPQFYQDIPSAGANHLVLGMVSQWGRFVGGEDNMIEELRDIIAPWSWQEVAPTEQ